MDRENLTARIEGASIRRGLISGGIFMAVARAMALVVQIAVGIMLARYLSPKEFGLFGMVSTLTGFIIIFKELGLSYATIQMQEVSYEQLNVLFWINAFVGLALTLVAAVSAWPVAALYKTPQVIPLTLTMSTVFFLSGISVQHAAILKRKMLFNKVAVAETASAILGALAGLFLVFRGAGVWALVAMQVVKGGAYNLLIWGYLPWLPTRPHGTAGIRAMVAFGGNIMAFDFVNYFSKNVDNILIGRLYGAVILGFYSKALELITLPITMIRGPLTAVCIPALSALQEDLPRFRRYFVTITQINALLCVPSMLWLALGADFLVPSLLGNQWAEAIPYFRLFAVAGIFQSTVGILGTLLIASGKSRRYFVWGLWHGAFMVLSYCTIFFTTPLTMVKIFVFANVAIFAPSAFYCASGSPIRGEDFLMAHLLPLGLGIVSLGVWFTAGILVAELSGIIAFVIRSITFFAVTGGWLIFHRKNYSPFLRLTVRQ
ncbi:lipopolysaccharide biosynthesis protein [Geothrix fuzhouensis]|uniref:lipopolysaccharide biosynthesis protein n=1 Tax=Geothrix fuzhouensis TaxID=2966451 RepID=UPI002149101C|nr:lipopolysaccharide biosynthesis protein [Geothrix fuzhouensis]